MVIIFQMGENFWIESIELPSLTMDDAAGQTDTPVVNLERPGDFLGSSIWISFTDNTVNGQAVASIAIRDQGGGNAAYGESITGVLARVTKQIGTGSAVINIRFLVFLRKSTG